MSHNDNLDQQARALAQHDQGDFAWPTLVLGLAVVAGYLATPFAVVWGYLPLPAGALLMAVLTYAAYTVLHDAVHGSISGSHPSLRWINESLGYLAAWILMIPLTAHRHEHLAHHRNTNQPAADPDYVVADMARSPWHALRAATRVVAGQYSYYLRQRWQVAPRAQNVRFCLEIALAVGLRLAFLAQGYWAEGALLFVSAGLGGVVVLMFLFAYIVHRPHEAVGRYVDTSPILGPGGFSGPGTGRWGYPNYHAIHHLFPRVPFYHYRRVFDQIGAIMLARGAPVYQLGWGGLRPCQSAPAEPASVTAG
jgi:beta-carotene hydroxylase